MGSDRALIVGVVFVKPIIAASKVRRSCSRLAAVFLPIAGGIHAAKEVSGITEHATTGPGVLDGATVLNSATLPVPNGVDGLIYDSIEPGVLALGVGIVGNDVVERASRDWPHSAEGVRGNSRRRHSRG